MSENKENILETLNEKPRVILGLDISTACIGATILVDDGSIPPKIAKITHFTPKISNKIKGIEALFLKKKLFEEEFLQHLTEYYITDVVIEEPLLSSNNVNTVATLLRFNGMVSDSVYNILGLVPCFISSYDARMFSFPDLVSLRKYNKKGDVYPLSHIKSAIKKDHLVLFGSYAFDVDKKRVMMNKVNEIYKDIEWIYNKKNELKKENFDACDSLVCALAYVNINRNGLGKPEIVHDSVKINEKENETEIDYDVSIWDKIYNKKIVIEKEKPEEK